MSENKEYIEAEVVDNLAENEETIDPVERDQTRIEEWHSANAEAPTQADMKKAERDVRDAEQLLEKARADFAAKAAHRATVHGWVSVGKEIGVSAKMLHAWRKEYHPDMPDLSTIPNKEMKREERRLAAEEQRIATIETLRKSVEERKARLSAGNIETGEQA